MRDIYLIDFENVASEGLSGITYLSEEDQVIIFYSNNSNRLTMKMHILIGKSVCQLRYFEVTVGGKNALDHQISTYLGYLIGTGAAERNYYIVSRDMGYKHVANFWSANRIGPKVRCIDAIKGASRLDRNRKDTVLQAMPQQLDTESVPAEPIQTTLSEPVEAAVADAAEVLPVSVESAPAQITQEAEAVSEQPEVAAPQDTPLPDMAALPEEPPVMEALPQPEIPAEEAQPQTQKRTYKSRTRTRSKARSKSYPQHTDAPAADVAEAPAVPVAETADAPTAPEQTPVQEEKKPAPKKKASPKSGKTAAKTPKVEDPKPAAGVDQLSAMIAPYPKLQESVLRDLIANNKRQVLCNTLRKHLGQEKGLALYNEIKRAAWH